LIVGQVANLRADCQSAQPAQDDIPPHNQTVPVRG
jgi:hypothetical protein